MKNKMNNIMNYENMLVKNLYSSLRDSNVIFYTNPFAYGYAPVLSFNIKNYDSNDVADFLNKKGFALRAGLHCSPTAHKKIKTLNCGTVRFSPSIFNNVLEVNLLINAIKNLKLKQKYY